MESDRRESWQAGKGEMILKVSGVGKLTVYRPESSMPKSILLVVCNEVDVARLWMPVCNSIQHQLANLPSICLSTSIYCQILYLGLAVSPSILRASRCESWRR